jgi:hypothetical protein
MADLVTLANFQTRYGRVLVGEEIDRVGAYITDASALVVDFAALDTAWTSATLPAVVTPIVCEVVRRAFDNQAGLQSETIGDYTWRGVKSVETSNVYLTADEKRTVRRAAGTLGVNTVTLSSDMTITPTDPRLYQAVLGTGDLSDTVIVNAAEPVDL